MPELVQCNQELQVLEFEVRTQDPVNGGGHTLLISYLAVILFHELLMPERCTKSHNACIPNDSNNTL
jgi:hypothetical protein